MFNPEDLLKSLLNAKQYAHSSHEKVKKTYFEHISKVNFHTPNISTQHQFNDYFKNVYNAMHNDHSSIFGSNVGKNHESE